MYECKFCNTQFASSKEMVNGKVCLTCLERERPKLNLTMNVAALTAIFAFSVIISGIIHYIANWKLGGTATTPFLSDSERANGFSNLFNIFFIYPTFFSLLFAKFYFHWVNEQVEEWDLKNIK